MNIVKRRRIMLADFHVHSEFSDDSKTPMEKQIQRAIALGIGEICFTDHVDYGIKKDWTEDILKWRGGDGIGTDRSDMQPLANVNYDEYFGKILRMKRLYGDQIVIRSGLEFGIQRHTIPDYERLIKTYGQKLDFILLSIHQVDNKEFWTGDFMKGKTQDEYNREYYEEMLYAVKHFDDFDVLSHVDLISRYDPQGAYPFSKIQDILTDIFECVIQKGKGIEINTSSWHYKLPDTTPSRDILKLYRSLGGEMITIGSDAHTPEYIGDHMENAMQILKELGFQAFYTYEKRKPVSHML
jgi:histidinol-phosphatase (PHP family)